MDLTGAESTRVGLQLSIRDLWIAYFALGGSRDLDELSRYLDADPGPHHDLDAPPTGHKPSDDDMIVHALNEAAMRQGWMDRLPYASD